MTDLTDLIEQATKPPEGSIREKEHSTGVGTSSTSQQQHSQKKKKTKQQHETLIEEDDDEHVEAEAGPLTAATEGGGESTTEGQGDINMSVVENAVDWPRFMQIVDEVSRDGSGHSAKQAATALLDHLNARNPAQVYLALLLLETLCKNCDDHLFHHLDNNDFKRKMTRIARGMTGEAPANKSLELVQQLALDPHLSKAFSTFRSTYTNLKKVNTKFPYQEESQVPPIFSPTPASERGGGGNQRPRPEGTGNSQTGEEHGGQLEEPSAQEEADIQAERFRNQWEMDNAKLHKDLETVRKWIVEAATLLSTAEIEGYNESTPKTGASDDLLGLEGSQQSGSQNAYNVSREIPRVEAYKKMFNTAPHLQNDEDFLDVMDLLQQSHERLEQLVDAGAAGDVKSDVFEQCLAVFEACNRVIIAADLYTGVIDPEQDLENLDQSKLAAVDASDLDIRDLMEFSNSDSRHVVTTRGRETSTTTARGAISRNQNPQADDTDDLMGSPDDWAIDSGDNRQNVSSSHQQGSGDSSVIRNAYTPNQTPAQTRQAQSQRPTDNGEGDLLNQNQQDSANTPAESVDSDNLLAEVDRTLEEDRYE
eukprot:gb/GECG01007838.1/.p1 GENE.gb/GECG01007838.1/~~gb/GECG01007838.1/.p1  ORF type:complete len:592 (+),score=120.80 gb/GECG01007838.1/:1-1776(+)